MKKFGKRIRNAEWSLAAYDDALYDLEVPEEAFGEDVIPAEEETFYVEEEEYYEEAELPEEDAYYEEVALSEEMYYSEEGEFSEEEEYYQGEDVSEEEDNYPNAEAVEEVYATEDYDTEEYMPEQEIYYTEEENSAEDTDYDEDDLMGLWSVNTSSKKKIDVGIMDKVIIGTGILVLILAVVIGAVYIKSRNAASMAAEFAGVGTQIENIEVIGGKGLLAVADALKSRQEAAEALKEQQKQEELEKEQDKEYNEIEYDNTVSVALNMTSVQKDLKIKFTNKDTGKLVANAPFSVTVTSPDNKNEIWSDEDMDGIIYKKGISSGDYKVAVNAFTEARYGNYILPVGKQLVDVKKEITYKKVDVSAEVKKETESEAKVEDTKKNETVVESVLQDTVAWIESTAIANTYTEILKSQIPDPITLEGNNDRFVLAAYHSSISPENYSLQVGDRFAVTASCVDDSANTLWIDSIMWNSSNPMVATVVGNGTSALVTAESAGDALISYEAVVTDEDGNVTEILRGSCSVTVASADISVVVDKKKEIVLDLSQLTLFTDIKAAISAQISNASGEEVLLAASSDMSVATVEVKEGKIIVAGIKEGSATITVSFTENGKEIKNNCVVTVKKHPKDDRETKLKDDKDNQLYVIENNSYREAVYADYYTADKFFVKGDTKYTGWQTIDGKVYYYTAAGDKVTGEQIIQGAKYNFAGDGSLVTGSGTLGIDVSKWNGKIDWEAVKNSGVSYVIIRCGYRGSSNGTLYEDQRFEENIKGATKAGLEVGVYFFTQATDEVEAVYEASFVLDRIKNYKISYPVFLDVEASGGRGDKIDKAARTAVCKAFCQTIQNAGYTAGIYANKTWLENRIDTGELGAYKVWLAQYVAEPTYTGRYDMWQYTCTGKISGISGDVDLNLSNLGY